MRIRVRKTAAAILMVLFLLPLLKAESNDGHRVRLQYDKDAHTVSVQIDGQEALVYQYGPTDGLAHYYPVRSPYGQSMTVQYPQVWPHHRSFWFADNVGLEGKPAIHFYNAWLLREKDDDDENIFPHRIRNTQFLAETRHGDTLTWTKKLLWEMNFEIPVLDEYRTVRIVPLGRGEYFLDMTFVVTASYGNVVFDSDWSHYAWPYVRMNKDFNVEDGGGRIVNSEGGINQAQTDRQEAVWVDYSCDVDGKTSGLSIFSHPDNRQPHKWLTRNYGTFGPRRTDDKWGTPFTLDKNESLVRRVGILVHRGDVQSGQVQQRYAAYVQGQL